MSAPLLILLVEDDEVDRKVVARTLKRAELEAQITEVGSLGEARAALQSEETFDCVLLDFRLPDGVALELLAADDEDESWAGVPAPVVVLTGHAEQALAEKCLQAGAQDYLVKGSFDDDALARAIRYARERWRLNRSLKQKARELRRTNVELEEFAYIVSHDLQEPLRTASRLAVRLGEHSADVLDDRGQEYLRRLNAATQRMSALIRDLLTLAHVGNVDASQQRDLDLQIELESVLEDLEERIRSSGATVELGELRPVRGVPSLIHQLLVNLVGNALKYHKPDVPPRVHVSCSRKRRGWVLLEVRDEGIGFEPEHADLVFMPFKRLKPKAYEGTGIGLPICKKIVELHGGRIKASGAPGEGATFSCLLPAPLRPDSSKRLGAEVAEGEPV